MPRENIPVFSFNAGITSPLLDGRIDLPWYKDGAADIVNMVCTPQGPLIARPGTEFKAPQLDHDKRAIVRPFVFGIVDGPPQAYMLGIEEDGVQFFTGGAQIAVQPTDAAITNGDFASDISGWTDQSTGTAQISHDATLAMLVLEGASASIAIAEQAPTTTKTGQEHVLRFDVLGIPGDTVTLRIGTSSGGEQILADVTKRDGSHAVAFTPTASPFYIQFRNPVAKDLRIDNVALVGSGAVAPAPLQVGAPWLEAELPRIKVTQSNDVLYLANPSRHFQELRRFGNTTWSCVRAAFKDGPYLPENVESTTLAPAATGGLAVTVTASAVTGINDGQGFLATDVGRLLTILHASTWGWGVIVSVTDTTHVKIDIKKSFGATSAVATWKLGLYSDTTGHPAALTFHEQRLILGGARVRPSNFDGSAIDGVGDVIDFTPGTDEDLAISGKMDANQVNPIQWLLSDRVLIVGTAGYEGRVGDLSSNETLKPGLLLSRKATNHGSADVQAIPAGRTALFVQRDGTVLREFFYSFNDDGYVAPDMTERAEHLGAGGLSELAYQQTPWSAVWAITDAGALLGFTYHRPQQVTAWHRHPIGAPEGTEAIVESIATIPGGFGAPDELWMIVQRTLPEGTRRYYERLARPWGYTDALEDAFFVDSGVSYSGAAVSSLGNAGHLEGVDGVGLADGVYFTATVASGNITLPFPATKVQFGLQRDAYWDSNRIASLADAAATFGGRQQIDGAALNFYRTVGGWVGRDDAHRDPVGTPITEFTAPPPLFSGIRRVPFPGTIDDDLKVRVLQDLPYPMILRSMRLSSDASGE